MTNASADICKAADKRLLKMSGKKEDMTQKYHVLIEQDEDGVFIGKVLELQGCVTQGDTLDELMKNVREAIELPSNCALRCDRRRLLKNAFAFCGYKK